MKKINFDDKFEIYLFTDPDETLGTSKLGEFLSFLKYNKINLPYKFTYVSAMASLIPELTMIQNILIDFSPDSLTESKDIQFQDFLKSQPNRALEELYHKLELPNEFPNQANAQMKKLCTLIKSLLYEGQFIFLDEPELDLDKDILELFKKALKEQVINNQMNVFIYSKESNLWRNETHNTVERLKDYSFHVTTLPGLGDWKKERDLFFKKTHRHDQSGILNFHYKNKDESKKNKKVAA